MKPLNARFDKINRDCETVKHVGLTLLSVGAVWGLRQLAEVAGGRRSLPRQPPT